MKYGHAALNGTGIKAPERPDKQMTSNQKLFSRKDYKKLFEAKITRTAKLKKISAGIKRSVFALISKQRRRKKIIFFRWKFRKPFQVFYSIEKNKQ